MRACGVQSDRVRGTILRLAEQGAMVERMPASMGQHGDVLVLRLDDDDAVDLRPSFTGVYWYTGSQLDY